MSKKVSSAKIVLLAKAFVACLPILERRSFISGSAIS